MNMNRIVRGLSLAAILAFGPGASVGCRPCTQNGGPAGVILEPILGALDAPARGNTLRGTGIVGGWAVAESRVKRIAIYVDGQFVSFAPLDAKRPDIAKLYAKTFPDAEASGWTTMLDVTGMADGEHQIVAQVKTNNGGIREFGPVPFKVAH
jgi:hypothetical protein